VADHDNSYKLLFSHPEMVRDLLRGFIREAWVRRLDFSSLEKFSGGYVSDNLRGRESDVVWRVRWKGEKDRWLYVYVLLELQSTVDSFMAVRMMTYVGLLYQDLIRQRLLTPDGKLPPVLPIVLYNGYAPWRAPLDMADLIDTVPGGLEQYRPQLRYCLLDEMRIASSELEPLKNLAAALFRLERSRGPEEVQAVVAALLEWLRAPEQSSLRRAFVVWFSEVFLPARLPGVKVPKVFELQEVYSVLAEKFVPWTEQWEQQGFEKGVRKGREEGLEEGTRKTLGSFRQSLLNTLEARFGPLSEDVRRKLEEINSAEELAELTARAGSASSLDALGLG
jgi:predicted transposase YdaD